MAANQTSRDQERGRILPFMRPGALRPPPPRPPADEAPVEDVGKYAKSDTPDDYRQRMTNNVLALGFCALLIVIGVWLANTIAEMRRNQDCVLAGRRNCAQVQVPPRLD
jgi:hypothetical protein